MINISVEGAQHAADTVRSMIGLIAHLKSVDLGMEMSDWQTEDLHRHRPFTMRSRAKGRVVTVIRPHSLYTMERSAYAHKELFRRIKRRKKGGAVMIARLLSPRRHWSTRPILRAEMEDIFSRRLMEMVPRLVNWQRAQARVPKS